jgi:holin-like protein
MKYLNQFFIILGFALVGEVLQRIVPLPIPASVYGIALLFLALCLKLVKVEQVKDVGGFLSSLLPVLFVSPTVGILEHWALIRPQLLPIALLLTASTVLVFGISGCLTQILMKKRGGKHD